MAESPTIILHTTFCNGAFVLWGETPRTPGTRLRPRGKTASDGVGTFPAGATRTALLDILRQIFPEPTYYLPPSKRYILWAPTLDGMPYFPETPAPPKNRATIAPWSITGLPLPAVLAEHLLVREPATFPETMRMGNEFTGWTGALSLMFHVARGKHFLPGINPQRDGVAAWIPVFSGATAGWLTTLAQAQPAVAWALTRDATRPPAASATEAMRDFISWMLTDFAQGCAIAPYRLMTGERTTQNAYYWYGYQRNHYDTWLEMLAAKTMRTSIAGDTARVYSEQIRDWTERIVFAPPANLRLCLRLEEPVDDAPDPSASDTDDDDDPQSEIDAHRADPVAHDRAASWRIRIFLQSKDDPSLLLELAAIAHPGLLGRLPLGLTPGAIQRTLMLECARYGAIWAPLEAIAMEAVVDTLPLDPLSAFTFLTETASALTAAGCLVQLPSWWLPSRPKTRVAVKARVSSKNQGPSLIGQDALLTFDWRVALGGQDVSLSELQSLARLKAPLVRVRGQWMQVNAEDIQSALAFLKKRGQSSATLSDVARLALDSGATYGGLPVEQVDLDGWVAPLLDRLRHGHAILDELAPPPGLRATLRPYQIRGYSWLRFLTQFGLGACLADDMGLGKTVQTLSLIQHDWEDANRRPVLVVCPTSVIGNWRREVQHFAPDLPVMIHHGGSREKSEQFAVEAARHALVVTSYALLHRDLAQIAAVPWRGIVLDEAQNIKNPETKQSQAAHELRADFRIALTGTPVENSVSDLWSLMQFLNPGLLGGQADFKRTFGVPIQVHQDAETMARLRQITGPFLLRRMKTDPSIIADLPEKQEMTVYCTLTKEQASLYAAVLRHMEEQLQEAVGIQRRGIILATLTKLKQVCNHPAHFLGDHSRLTGRSGKLERLDEMLEEALAEGDHALIFTQFAEMGELLREHLRTTLKHAIPFLHGGVPQHQREAMIADFQSDDGPPIFLLSLKAGGLGLNLTRANRVFHFDRWWNPAVENQATDRAFRIGQTRAVQVHKFVCLGTLEERIEQMIDLKMGVAANVIGSGEGWLTELSTEQLRDVFALRAEATAF